MTMLELYEHMKRVLAAMDLHFHEMEKVEVTGTDRALFFETDHKALKVSAMIAVPRRFPARSEEPARYYYEPLPWGSRHPSSFHVYDRKRQREPNQTVAICHDRDDAERIVAALNAEAK